MMLVGESYEVYEPNEITLSFLFQRSDFTSIVCSLLMSEFSIKSLIEEDWTLKTFLKAAKSLTKFESFFSSEYINSANSDSSMY